MSTDALLDLWREALATLLAVSAPFLIATLAVGLAVAILQTATQLQENVLTFLPKLGATLLVIALAGHWALDRLGTFTITAFQAHADHALAPAPAPSLDAHDASMKRP